MKKLILASADWCGPCKMIKSRLKSENLLEKVELKDADVDVAFFRENNIKSIPRLLVLEEDKVVDMIQGTEAIIKKIEEQ